MKTKKLLALLLTLSLLTMSSVFAVTPVAAVTETVHAWDGTSTTVFDGGDGRAAAPPFPSSVPRFRRQGS